MSSQSKSGSVVVFNLIIELATVSVIYVQKSSKYQNNHIKVVTRKLLASFFRELSLFVSVDV